MQCFLLSSWSGGISYPGSERRDQQTAEREETLGGTHPAAGGNRLHGEEGEGGEREREKRREIERGREGTERGGDGAIMEGDRGEGSEKIDGRESGRERGKERMG